MPGVCRFALVIGSKTTYFRLLFYFFGSKLLFTKSTPRSKWSGGSFGHCFILFRARETQLYEKGPPWSLLFRILFRLSKQEKKPSFSFVRLIKHSMTSDIVNMTHIKHMLPPSSLSSKNNRGTCLQRWGKWNYDYSRLGSTSLLNMALRCFVSGWVHLILFSLASMGLGYPI